MPYDTLSPTVRPFEHGAAEFKGTSLRAGFLLSETPVDIWSL